MSRWNFTKLYQGQNSSSFSISLLTYFKKKLVPNKTRIHQFSLHFSSLKKKMRAKKKRKEVFFIQLPLLFQKRNWKKKENPRIVGDRFEGKQKKRSAFGEPRYVCEKNGKRRYRIIRRCYFHSPNFILSYFKYERKLMFTIFRFHFFFNSSFFLKTDAFDTLNNIVFCFFWKFGVDKKEK